MGSYVYIDDFLRKNDYMSVMDWLKLKTFKKGVNNDGTIIKRKQLWFQEDGLPFVKRWEKYDRWCSEKKYDDILFHLQELITNKLTQSVSINSCLINRYEDGSDFIQFHQDSSEAFGKEHYTIILSIGQERILQFRNVDNHKDIIDIPLKNNSLLYIPPSINIKYQHSLIKDESINSRYSFTFRKFLISI